MGDLLAVKVVLPITIDATKLTVTNVSGTAEGTAWVAATNYAKGARVYRNDLLYERLVSGTSAATPDSDAVNWLLVGATNTYRMFDNSNTSQTSNADSIQARVAPGGVANTLALFNVDATNIDVSMVDPVAGVVFSKNYKMQAPPKKSSWYSYFTDPITMNRDLVVSLPSFWNAYVEVSINKPGGIAKCGTMILGKANLVGNGINYGAGVGIIDYSTKEKNVFGDSSVIERNFAKRANFTIQIENSEVDSLINLLTDLRAKPTLYVGSSRFTSTAIYGFYKEFNVLLSYVQNSICEITLEGLS